MTNTTRHWLIAAVFGLLVLAEIGPYLTRPSTENQWGPFTGTVVDGGTGQPIAGAVFTVIWIREIPFIGHAAEQFFDARVAVADEQGRFEIPQRSQPLLFPGLVKRPYLSCVAPGHTPYEHPGHVYKAPIPVLLQPLPSGQRRANASWTETLGLIPDAQRAEFSGAINSRRRQLGLAPVDFVVGNLERGQT